MDRINDWVNTQNTGAAAAVRPVQSMSNVIDLTLSEASSSPLSVRPAPTQPQLFIKRPSHPSTSFQSKLPFREASNTPTTSSAPFSFAASNEAFRSKSLKDKLTESIQAQNKLAGIPLAIPENPPYKKAPAAGVLDDEDAVLEAMKSLNVSDNLAAGDQERELKKLLEGMADMDDVEIDQELPPGMTSSLRPYQQEGLSWLKNRESGGKKRGGILGDDMGLGKTVQMIGLMLANRSTTRVKTTLIVCPVSLLDQWQSEIEKHSDGSLSVVIHHGPKRTKHARALRRKNVVITSYATVASEWSDPKPKKKKASKGKEPVADDDEDDTETTKYEGPLFDMAAEGGFFRIILDEAHTIKNRASLQHKACCALSGNYRWCLTGTPVQNEVGDLFSLFEFLGKKIVAPMHDYSEFKAKIADPLKNKRAKTGMARLVVILKAVMLRRTKDMLVDGKPIVQLPNREVIAVGGPFLDIDERHFYEAVEAKMLLKMNSFLKAGTAMSNYTSVLTLLLRMRQACAHPSLALARVDMDALEMKIDNTAAKGNVTPPSGNSSSSNPLRRPSQKDGEVDELSGVVDALAVKQNTCGLCAEPLSEDDDREEETRTYCDDCQVDFGQYDKLSFSTKIKRMMRILEDIRVEGTGRKTIVFSQFTSMFDLIEPFLKKGGFKFVRFDGKVNQPQRVKVLDAIKNDPRTTVILISIKSGSVGLNLTCCCRVILMDLWWNPAIEAQAFDRAHRMGQTEDVKIYKITVDNTIEDRILTLQEQKAQLAKACLDGGDFKKGNKLNMADLLLLFKRGGDD